MNGSLLGGLDVIRGMAEEVCDIILLSNCHLCVIPPTILPFPQRFPYIPFYSLSNLSTLAMLPIQDDLRSAIPAESLRD